MDEPNRLPAKALRRQRPDNRLRPPRSRRLGTRPHGGKHGPTPPPCPPSATPWAPWRRWPTSAAPLANDPLIPTDWSWSPPRPENSLNAVLAGYWAPPQHRCCSSSFSAPPTRL